MKGAIKIQFQLVEGPIAREGRVAVSSLGSGALVYSAGWSIFLFEPFGQTSAKINNLKNS